MSGYPFPDDVEPVTAAQAAQRLERARGTIGAWVTRYQVLSVGTVNGTSYYDYVDLAIIEREIRLHRPVPDTWVARRELRVKTSN